jgi:hypothetical protein
VNLGFQVNLVFQESQGIRERREKRDRRVQRVHKVNQVPLEDRGYQDFQASEAYRDCR